MSELYVRRRRRIRAGHGRPVGGADRTRTLGRGPLPRRRRAAGRDRNDTKRGGEIDRFLAVFGASSLAPDADGNIWWDTGPGGVGQAHGRRLQGPARRRPLSIEIIANEVLTAAVPHGSGPLPATGRATSWPSSRCGSCTGSCSCSTPRPRRSWACSRSARREYDEGYSLDRLRELVLVDAATPRGPRGTHLYESLGVLFRLVDDGHARARSERRSDGIAPAMRATGWTSTPLQRRPLPPGRHRLIDEVGLGNAALQQVLAHLLLSKEKRGKDRGFISYAELGINQLGAVYEGLMSYTGFFAETDLYEVAKDGDRTRAPGWCRSTAPTASTPSDFVKVDGRGHRRAEDRCCTGRARSSSGWPAGNASSPRRTTRRRC